MELASADETQALARLKRIMANKRVEDPVKDFVPLDSSGPPIAAVLGSNHVMRLLDRPNAGGVTLLGFSLFLSVELRQVIVERARAAKVPLWGIRKSPLELGALIGGLGRSSCVCFALVNQGSSADPLFALRLSVVQMLAKSDLSAAA